MRDWLQHQSKVGWLIGGVVGGLMGRLVAFYSIRPRFCPFNALERDQGFACDLRIAVYLWLPWLAAAGLALVGGWALGKIAKQRTDAAASAS